MKKIFLFLFVSLFLFFEIIAQNNLPPVYEIKSDTAYRETLDSNYWQVLEDKSGKWTIDEVKTKSFGNIITKEIDTTLHTYWFRYRLKNIVNKEVNIALESRADQSDFFVLQNSDQPKHFITGYKYPWNKKDGLKQGNYIPVILKSGEEAIIYQRLFNYKAGITKDFAIAFVNTEKEIQNEFKVLNTNRADYYEAMEIQEAFIVGLLFLTIFFNLFYYRVIREKINLYFALFAFFLGVNRLYNILQTFFVWEHPLLVDYVRYLSYAWAFIPFFLIQFIREFFQTKVLYKKWDRWLFWLALSNMLLWIFAFFTIRYFKSLNDFFFNTRIIPWLWTAWVVIPLNVLITLLVFIREKDISTRFLIIGASPLMLSYILFTPIEILNFSSFLSFIAVYLRAVEVICVIWLILFFSWTLFIRYNDLRKKSAQQALDNERLAKEKEIERRELIEFQKTELEEQVSQRTFELKHSLDELKSTQAQLIQSEKMASLGELTAGIAHEIQNPLNFVNNFSEVNNELIDELKHEAEKGNIDEVKIIADDIKENSEKINHHGKRADAIVKGMLQHSRLSTGQKEPTDINKLADEYLRLSYHGMRAKDKSFNAKLQTDFDDSNGKINVVPQDIGRVLLNLFNNAFYAVMQKNASTSSAGQHYEPTVSVSTKKLDGKIEIYVKDNGIGIPQKVVDKIFQPFFTTKPTGQGTGLGLSLSYDIVKAHGGEIKVETKEGEGAEFIIQLLLT